MRRALFIVACLFATQVFAKGWTFAPAVTVSQAHGAKIHHHLESAGRKNIAASGDAVAIAWEDDRSGEPRTYVGVKSGDGAFREHPLSQREAYEPAIVALTDGRFLCAWEEGDAVWMRVVGSDSLGTPVRIGRGAQVSLGAHAGNIYAVWREPRTRGHTISIAALAMSANAPRAARAQALAATGDQLYPSVAVNARGAVVVAWEDRRAGHTRIFYTFKRVGARFAAARPLNQTVRGSAVFGKGSGAARVALTTYGTAGFAAAWLDKRDFRSGYDVYAARDAQGRGVFAANEKVQDEFGANISQWHAAIAGTPQGNLVIAWDDDRDESADVFLAERGADDWGENRPVDGASGEGEQAYPAIAIGADDMLHVAWVETLAGGTRLRYTRATRQ